MAAARAGRLTGLRCERTVKGAEVCMPQADENEILTRVGPGTLTGDLLRRYWTPACLSAEIPEAGGAPVRVKLLGERLVGERLVGERLAAFRDTTGRVGLVQENCPHRGASPYFGRNEDAAIHCVYHATPLHRRQRLPGRPGRAEQRDL